MKKHIIYLLFLLPLFLSSCKEEKKSTIIITKKAEVAQSHTPFKTGDFRQSRTVTWREAQYVVSTELKAVDSLPQVHDGAQRFFDNGAHVRVTRADGSVFFERSFTKKYFKEWLPEHFYNDGALLGVVFYNADRNYLYFAVTVGNPNKSSDEYVPLVMCVDYLGNITVRKDLQMDTAGEAGEMAEG